MYLKKKLNKMSAKKLKGCPLSTLNLVVKLSKAKKKEKVALLRNRRKISTMALG